VKGNVVASIKGASIFDLYPNDRRNGQIIFRIDSLNFEEVSDVEVNQRAVNQRIETNSDKMKDLFKVMIDTFKAKILFSIDLIDEAPGAIADASLNSENEKYLSLSYNFQD